MPISRQKLAIHKADNAIVCFAHEAHEIYSSRFTQTAFNDFVRAMYIEKEGFLCHWIASLAKINNQCLLIMYDSVIISSCRTLEERLDESKMSIHVQ